MRLTNLASWVLVGVASGVATAMPPVVSFENIDGEPVAEGLAIGEQYWESHGVRFTNSEPGHDLVLAKVGAPFRAFRGYLGTADMPFPGATVGQFFLTDTHQGAGTRAGPFRLEYRWPVSRISGVFLDVNEQESWRAEAFDASGASRGSVQIFPTLLPGSAMSWSLETDDKVITRVEITFTGTAPPSGVTFALDNIGGSEPSCLADINEDGLVDFADYLQFLGAYALLDLLADFNGDGEVDFSDYLGFLSAFDAGC